MASFPTKLMMTVAVFGLMACGGGSSISDGGATTPPVTPGGGTPTTPTPPPTVANGTNGLSFGAAGQTLSDAETRSITTRAASVQSGLRTATVTLGSGFIEADPTARNGTIELAGETVTITNGAGALSTGENVVVTFEPDRAGTYTGAIEVTIAGGPANSTLTGENAFVFGFETNPDTISDRVSGRLEYAGGFQAFGDVGTEYEGDMTVLVDFGTASNAQVTLDGQLNGTTDADLGGTLAITDTGFAGTLNCTAGCTSTGSLIDAGFFGPDADELGGVLELGITAGSDTFDGVGTFVLTDPVAR